MKLSTAKTYFEDYHKDGEVDKFIDLFPTDKYRTDNLSIPLFKFDYSAFPVNSSHVSYFDKNFKNPKANELPLEERVPLTHYKTEEINQPHVEDVFENNIIQNQKNIKFPRKELPEKYAYGLDHKGLGDIAYERLDIENGDTNELSRNLENFYENQYLKQVEPEKMRKLENIEKGIKKHGNNPDKQEKIEKAKALKQEIIEVEIPEILGKTPKYHEERFIYEKFKPLQNKPDRVLSQQELYEINNILISNGKKALPVGTRSKAAARKLNLIDDGLRQFNDAENAATKIQSKVRQTNVTNLKKDPEFKNRVQNRIEDIENEGKALKLEGAVAKAQKLARKKLSKNPSLLGGFEESKASEIEPDDFFNPKTEERREKKIQEKNKRLAEKEAAATKIQSKVRQKKAVRQTNILKDLNKINTKDEQVNLQNLAQLGHKEQPVRRVSKTTPQFEGDKFIPKGDYTKPQQLLLEYVQIKDKNPDDAEDIKTKFQEEFNETELRKLVNQTKITDPKTGEPMTAYKKKMVKEELMSPVKQNNTSKVLNLDMTPNPVFSHDSDVLTIDKLATIKSSYKKGDKIRDVDRETLDLYNIKVDGRKQAISIFDDIINEFSTKSVELGKNADEVLMDLRNKREELAKYRKEEEARIPLSAGGLSSKPSRLPQPKTLLGPASRNVTVRGKTNKAGKK